MELAWVYPNQTAGSIGNGVTLGVEHRFPIRPDEVVELHQVQYWANAAPGGNGTEIAWALSFDATHVSPVTDLNAQISDVKFRDNNNVWLRHSDYSRGTAANGFFGMNCGTVIPMHGYRIGRSVICLFFNEAGVSLYMGAHFWWKPVKVGIGAANSMHMRRSVME